MAIADNLRFLQDTPWHRWVTRKTRNIHFLQFDDQRLYGPSLTDPGQYRVCLSWREMQDIQRKEDGRDGKLRWKDKSIFFYAPDTQHVRYFRSKYSLLIITNTLYQPKNVPCSFMVGKYPAIIFMRRRITIEPLVRAFSCCFSVLQTKHKRGGTFFVFWKEVDGQ